MVISGVIIQCMFSCAPNIVLNFACGRLIESNTTLYRDSEIHPSV